MGHNLVVHIWGQLYEGWIGGANQQINPYPVEKIYKKKPGYALDNLIHPLYNQSMTNSLLCKYTIMDCRKHLQNVICNKKYFSVII